MILMLVFVVTLVIALVAQWQVRRMYRRYSQVPATGGYTGAEAAHEILRAAGVRDVDIVEHNEMLGDHYDPIHRRLVLSADNYHGTSLAALGVAAHEAGHALQHQQGYKPLHWRVAAVGATNFASQIVTWLPLIGMATGLLATYTGLAIMAGAWGLIMAFNLVTLPVEFDASRRAKAMLMRLGFVSGHAENAAVAKVLNAAAMTYLAALVTSLLELLKWVMFARNRED
jgi:hypothetical protein